MQPAVAVRETYTVDDEGQRVPSHAEAYIEPPCCTAPSSNGLYECGCGGMSTVVCPAIDCPGISDNDAERLFEELA